jgi:hypothetical protein
MHLQRKRSTDILVDSMGMVLHMFALQRVPTQCMLQTSAIISESAFFEDEQVGDEFKSNLWDEAETKISVSDLERIWNASMETAAIDDALCTKFVAMMKIPTDLQVPCIHSPLCFAFSLRLLFDMRATEALDICEYWLGDLEKTRKSEDCFVWYRTAMSACKALACAILSQGIKAREILKVVQNELETYDLPGLRAYISCIGLLAAGALCSRRHNTANDSTPSTSHPVWTNPNLWKKSAVIHTLRYGACLEREISAQTTNLCADKNTSKHRNRLNQRRLSNIFEDHEVRDRESFLKDSDLMILIMNQHSSLVAGLTRMKQFSSAELTESKCIFADLLDHVQSWMLELDAVIVSASVQTQQL